MTCSGVVVRDEGNVSSTGYESPLRVLRWSSVRRLLELPFGGSAISDPRAPDGDQRLVAVPATPSPYQR